MIEGIKTAELNQNGLLRMKAVQRVLDGEPIRVVGLAFGVTHGTILKWCDMYNTRSVPRLNSPFRPRAVYNLDAGKISALLENPPKGYRSRLQRLLRLAKGEPLVLVAAESGVSAQSIMKDRRQFTAGKWKLKKPADAVQKHGND